jgi:hypothetical protein
MEGANQIEAWEPGKYLRTSSDRPEGPPNVVEYFIEGRSGSTVLRLVHSGFTASADFDGEFESTGNAWPVFMQMLKHSVERGVAACRNVTIFRMLESSREEAWAKLQPVLGLDGAAIRHLDPRGYACADFADRNHAMLAVFCESCGGKAMLTLTWLLYGASDSDAASLQDRWTSVVDALAN